jgi:predicted O-methyltransferase YrrM
VIYYLRKAIVHTAKRGLGRRIFPPRYDQLLAEVDAVRPKTILEIGTYDGFNAARLVRRALRYRDDVEYYGFDLFEALDDARFLREFSLKPPSQKEVDRFLARNGVRNRFLFAGDTTRSIPQARSQLPPMDLVFIDGGHSYETVSADWRNIEPLLHRTSVVYFDDWPNFGVGPLIEEIDRQRWHVRVLPVRDVFRANTSFEGPTENGYRGFQFVRVQARRDMSVA